MIIIIEGVDLAGKTYAIEQIAKYFNSGFILKNAYKPKTKEDSEKVYTNYWNILSAIDDFSQNNIVILDRFYPSQAVYSILRGVDEMEHNEIAILENIFALDGAIYVYLDTDIETMENRYDIRGDEHIKKEQIKMLKERYDKFFEKTKLRKIKINTLEAGWLLELEKFIIGDGIGNRE